MTDIHTIAHRVKFWWKTRHWDRSHFPGCDIRYGRGTQCLDPDNLCVRANLAQS